MWPSLTLSVFFKDEAEMLRQTLPSWVVFADELVLVDTGSTDGSVDLALSLLAEVPLEIRPAVRVYASPWRHDFAHHYNELMDLSTTDWNVLLDADFQLGGSPVGLRRHLSLAAKDKGSIGFVALFQDDGKGGLWAENGVPRMFHKTTKSRWNYVTDQLLKYDDVDRVFTVSHHAFLFHHMRNCGRDSSIDRSDGLIWRRMCSAGKLTDREIAHYECALGLKEV